MPVYVFCSEIWYLLFHYLDSRTCHFVLQSNKQMNQLFHESYQRRMKTCLDQVSDLSSFFKSGFEALSLPFHPKKFFKLFHSLEQTHASVFNCPVRFTKPSVKIFVTVPGHEGQQKSWHYPWNLAEYQHDTKSQVLSESPEEIDYVNHYIQLYGANISLSFDLLGAISTKSPLQQNVPFCIENGSSLVFRYLGNLHEPWCLSSFTLRPQFMKSRQWDILVKEKQ